MNKEELELIEKNAATILAGYIANNNYSSKNTNEYISEAIDYAIELHKQIETKLVTHERIKLGTYNLKHTTIFRPRDDTPRISYLRCLVCGEVHYDGEACPHSKFTSKEQL